jgi:trehalose 6-phosphate phosphatase
MSTEELQKKQCPSAVRMFKKLMVEAKAKQVVVFLDYDGTLSPIVDDPDRAHMSDDVRETLLYFKNHFCLAGCREKSLPKFVLQHMYPCFFLLTFC